MSKLIGSVVVATLSVVTLRADAEVVGAAAHGFQLRIKSEVDATPQQVYRAIVQDVSKWWDKNHTYTGRANNLYLEAKPGGWFGEKLPNGGFVRHMQIAYLAPGKALRMLGGLGPLQELGVSGALTINLRRTKDDKTEVRLIYAVSGFVPNGLDKLAKPVNSVLSQQIAHLKSFVERAQSKGR